MILGIVGDGIMGRDITLHCAAFPLAIRWVVKKADRQMELEALLARRIRRLERYGNDTGEFCRDWQVSHDAAILADCHLVIEAVPENPDLKIRVTSLIEEAVSTDCVIASNSSSIPGSVSASGLRYPDRALGLHFFHPLAMRNIVEINLWESTGEAAVSLCREFLEILGMKSVEFKSGRHFLLNRILLPLQAAAAWLLIGDISAQRISELDEILDREILPGGAFRFFDAVGFSVAAPSVRSYTPSGAHPLYEFLSMVLEGMMKAGFHGEKSGAGFYLYPDRVANPELPLLLESLYPVSGKGRLEEGSIPMPDLPSDSCILPAGEKLSDSREGEDLFLAIWAEIGRRLIDTGQFSAETLNSAVLEVTGGNLGPVDAFRRFEESDVNSRARLVDWHSDVCSQLDISKLVSII